MLFKKCLYEDECEIGYSPTRAQPGVWNIRVVCKTVDLCFRRALFQYLATYLIRNATNSFVGSEFAYEDLGSQEIEKYTDRVVIRDEECPNSKGKENCHVIERKPVEKSSGYSRQILWIDQTPAHRVWKIDFFDRKESLLKTLNFSDYKIYLDKFWRPSKYFMINHQTGKSTDLFINNIEFKVGLSSEDFNQKSLSRVR